MSSGLFFKSWEQSALMILTTFKCQLHQILILLRLPIDRLINQSKLIVLFIRHNIEITYASLMKKTGNAEPNARWLSILIVWQFRENNWKFAIINCIDGHCLCLIVGFGSTNCFHEIPHHHHSNVIILKTMKVKWQQSLVKNRLSHKLYTSYVKWNRSPMYVQRVKEK